ncbi:MAG: BACON domain-containing carbohydrate-binding protein [Dysgonamonadaceae bacterium]|nr:BACON domain-containing carbohydrate-binding protein [Dysgonamonadaceae bacterium]
MRKSILLLLSLSLVILSCQKEEEPFIRINQTQFTVSDAGGSQTISFETNMSWNAKSSESWCNVLPASGDASTKSTKVTLSTNDTYDDRSCTVTIMAGGLFKTITINQSTNLGLFVSPDKFDLSNDATTIEVEIRSNVEFDVITSDDWISKNSTRSLSSSKLYFNIAKNESYDNRSGSINIKQKDGTLTKTIKVYQSQKDAIILSNKTQEISSESQTLEVELKTNVDFEVIIPEAAKNWVSYIGTRALRTETLILDIAENEDNNAHRSTEIYVMNRATSLQDTLTIIQEKAPDLPSLTTLDAYDISIYSAKSGGEILNDGGAPILAKGVCWNTLENPTIQNSKTDNGSGVDNFIANITDLNAATKYYARAYATNRSGTSYGNQIIFTTTSIVATPIISPIGGIYSAVQTVSITCATDGAEIRYTLDGSEPRETSELYSSGILIDAGITIKAKAFKENWMESSVATETYIINLDAQLIEGSANIIQHIDASEDFVFRLNNLNDKDVFFVFSNQNSSSSTPLPQIDSNVATISTTAKSMSFSEPSFIVSGKPSITEFNNNPWKQSMDGIEKLQYQQYSVSQPEKLVLGFSDYLNDEYGTPQLSTVRKVISAHGKTLYVWVADNCWGEESTKSYNVTQQMVDALASKFLNQGEDNDIYEWVTNIAGDPWGPTTRNYLIPETDDIHIWLTDIDDDNKTTGTVTVGYFFARDNFRKTSISTSNEKLMFTIDAVLFGKTTNGSWDLSHFWPNVIISTLAHEFTHMIYFYQHEVLRNLSSNSAVNEMCAQCVEDLVSNKILADGPRGISYATPDAGSTGNYDGRLPLYNKNNDYNLLDWSSNNDEELLNYSKTYALGAYLMRNFGGANFIRELIQNNSTGINSIVDAVNSNGGAGLNYGDILQRFGAANLLSNRTTMTTGYKFNTGTWSTSIVNGVTYDLGSINLYNYSPTPYVYNILPSTQKPGSNIYYRAGSNLRGEIEWSFQGMSLDTKLTVVIK